MSDKPTPPKRSGATIRPYIGQSLLTAARALFPRLNGLTDREFVEFCLMQAMASPSQPVIGLPSEWVPSPPIPRQIASEGSNGIDEEVKMVIGSVSDMATEQEQSTPVAPKGLNLEDATDMEF